MNNSIKSPYREIDTPALLVDRAILVKNIEDMQARCDKMRVALRPHTKTHKCPDIAKMQQAAGARGISVAKTGEAEAMAANGITDIFVANEVIGQQKLERLCRLSRQIKLSFGVDSVEGIKQADDVFSREGARARVVIEIETGEVRSGVETADQMAALIKALKSAKSVDVLGVFSHEGFSYKAKSREHCVEIFEQCQARTALFAQMLVDAGLRCDVVSVGATPTAWLCERVHPQVTELRPGTYALMDIGQSNAIGTTARCAASVLTSVISKPAPDRVICDVGAKGLTMQSRIGGICETTGFGLVRGSDIRPSGVYDEHLIFIGRALPGLVEIGDKIEVIPNHICPVCNLYDEIYLVENGEIISVLPVSCRGKLT